LSDRIPHNADSQDRRDDGQDGPLPTPPIHGEESMISPVAAPVPTRQQNLSPRFPELSIRLEKDLVQVFKLLADETRLKVLLYLMQEGELHVSALCERLHQSQPAVSHHLALLREAGLIEPRRDGKHNFYSVKKSKFHHLIQQLFDSMSNDGNGEVRFDDFVLTQQ
jgi:ArsR family transcriptional regulator, arsenate/arsenite/antimonite-responsive transcriptional repressor